MEYNRLTSMETLDQGLREINIVLTDLQLQQFMDYYELLIEWNKVMNLTAITDIDEVIKKHFVDSLSIIKVIHPDKEYLLDIGTGAGFPGIPLKIAFPGLKIVLLDSLNKRIHFLEEVIHHLKLKDITAHHKRAEEYAHEFLFREKFDICVSRAVAKLSVLSEYCLPYVKKGGSFISYKSGNIEEELKQSEYAIRILGGEVKNICNFMLPDSDIERALVLIQKTKNTPGKYPRGAGKPAKDPLS